MQQDSRHGAEALHQLLVDRGIDHEIVPHPPTFRARDEADAVGVAPGEVTKTVVAVDHDRSWLVVLPASRHVDLARLREHVGATSHLRLATEPEIAARFGDFDVGATPPFGAMLGVPEVVDIHVLEHERVLCSAGDHEHAVRLSSEALVAAGAGTVADICERTDDLHRARFSEVPLN